MQLRILRTWRWVANRDMSMPIGMKAPLHLAAKDELQFRDHHGDWLPLPIVEAEKPEHPDVVEDKRRSEEMQAAVDRLVADGKIKFPNGEVRGASRLAGEASASTVVLGVGGEVMDADIIDGIARIRVAFHPEAMAHNAELRGRPLADGPA